MESFAEWTKRLSDFLRGSGLPARVAWVDWGDVLISQGRLYVRGFAKSSRPSTAETRFQRATDRGVGISLEAVCKVGDASCCFVYLPRDQDEAQRLMIPQTGVKLSVPTLAAEARTIKNPIAWWYLKLHATDYLRQFYQ